MGFPRRRLVTAMVAIWSVGGCASQRSEVVAAPSRPASSARPSSHPPDEGPATQRKRVLLRCGSAPDETTLAVLSETATALRLMDMEYVFDQAERHDAVLTVQADCRPGVSLTGELRLQAGSEQATRALSTTKRPADATTDCRSLLSRDLSPTVGELFGDVYGEDPGPEQRAGSVRDCAERASRLRPHDYWRDDSTIPLDREPLPTLLSVLSTEANACRCSAVSALKDRYLADEKLREATRSLLEAADPEVRRGGAYIVAVGRDPKAYAWAKRVLQRADDGSEVLANAAALVGNLGTAEDTATLLALSSGAAAQGTDGRDLRRNLACSLEKLTGRAQPDADEDTGAAGLTPAVRAKLVGDGELRCGSVVYTCRTKVLVLSQPKYTAGKCALEPLRTEKRLLEARVSYTPPARRAKRAGAGG
jgi:hypothetical protein